MYMMLRRVDPLNKECLLHLCGLPTISPPPYEDFKSSPQLRCSSKSCKYDNYDKAPYTPYTVHPGKTLCQAIHWPHRLN